LFDPPVKFDCWDNQRRHSGEVRGKVPDVLGVLNCSCSRRLVPRSIDARLKVPFLAVDLCSSTVEIRERRALNRIGDDHEPPTLHRTGRRRL